MKIVSVINEKGGTAKSTISWNLAYELMLRGERVLLLDLDSQRANITFMAGIEREDGMLTMYDVLVKKLSIKKTIKVVEDNLHIVPADISVSDIKDGVNLNTFNMALNEIRPYYDWVFIDVPPSPGVEHFITMCVADYLIIPMLADVLSLEANLGIAETIHVAKERNPKLRVLGLVVNRYKRTLLGNQVLRAAESIAAGLDTTVFETKLRDNVAVAEAVGSHIGVTAYKPKSNGSMDIKHLLDEVLERIGE